jgi:hypothetical protein
VHEPGPFQFDMVRGVQYDITVHDELLTKELHEGEVSHIPHHDSRILRVPIYPSIDSRCPANLNANRHAIGEPTCMVTRHGYFLISCVGRRKNKRLVA